MTDFLTDRKPGEIWFCQSKNDPDGNWGLFQIEENLMVTRLANHNGPIYGDYHQPVYDEWVTNGRYTWTKIV